MTKKDIKATATIMRDQHGAYAEEFVRKRIQHHRAKPELTATWMAVLSALKETAPDVLYAKHG